MPSSEDLHGNVPDESSTALLIIDTINDLEFEGGEQLLTTALPAAEKIAQLKRRAKHSRIPVIYVNDNFGKWQSDFKKQVTHCLKDGVRGEPLARLLVPEEDDYFVLKPKHSGFYSTSLDILLAYLKARTLILTGLTGDMCVLFTAYDAYVRDFHLQVPADCVASIDPEENQLALRQMQRVLKADVRPSTEIDFHEAAHSSAS
ncbi:MAG TPA: cysteine hydrolase [Blastocatellia bacterium]|nr:cysteine hydrolase [Blastocatellia bacterium]